MKNQATATNNQNKKIIVRHLTDKSTATKPVYTAEQLGDILANIHRLRALWNTADKQTENAERPDIYAERNEVRKYGIKDNAEFQEVCIDLLNYVAITATYKTLNYLASHGATYTATTDDITATKKDDVSPLGYNMAVKLLRDLPHDIATYKHTETATAYTDSIDLLQEVFVALVPFVCSDIEITPETVIYTKTIKNGNEKDYTLFSLACLTIRRYIQGHAQKQYKKIAYVVGYTDEGNAVYSTKRPAVELTDIDENEKMNFLKTIRLTTFEHDVLKLYLDGKTTEEIATAQNISIRTAQHHLKTAKDKIRKQYKMI